MTKFTKGPLRVCQENIYHGYYVENDQCETICDFYFINKSDGKMKRFNDAEANAYLVSAAPDMYEFIEHIAECALPDYPHYEELAQKLLAKARGES